MAMLLFRGLKSPASTRGALRLAGFRILLWFKVVRGARAFVRSYRMIEGTDPHKPKED